MSSDNYGLGKVQPQFERVPNLFLLDTSGSMREETPDEEGNERPKIEQLNEGLELFEEEIGKDIESREGVDVSLVTFGGDVSIEEDFHPVKDWVEGSGPPELTASRGTPMSEAIIKGLENLEDYKDAVNDESLGRKRALVWLLTDGKPNSFGSSDWETAKSAVANGAKQDAFFFYAVGIGDDADMDNLQDLISDAPGNEVEDFHLEEGKFREFFQIASDSARGESMGGGSESAEEALAQQDPSETS
jgi:uncharacterized protein YegL